MVSMNRACALLLLMLSSGCSTRPTLAENLLTRGDAHVLAEKLAMAKHRSTLGSYDIFKDSNPPKLIHGRWVWFWRRGIGHADIEIRVSFERDGTSPEVDWLCLSSRIGVHE